MSYRKQVKGTTCQLAAKDKDRAGADANKQPALVSSNPTMQRVLRQIEAGKYEKAIDLLNSAGRDAQIQNARGVCLMRLGRFEEAIRVLRNLVLNPGCTWMRPDVPAAYKTNFATALLLGGHPSGCLDMLAEIRQEQDSAVQRLRAAIKQWERTLSFWQKLNWRLCRIEPSNRPVKIDFPPGDLAFRESEHETRNPDRPSDRDVRPAA